MPKIETASRKTRPSRLSSTGGDFREARRSSSGLCGMGRPGGVSSPAKGGSSRRRGETTPNRRRHLSKKEKGGSAFVSCTRNRTKTNARRREVQHREETTTKTASNCSRTCRTPGEEDRPRHRRLALDLRLKVAAKNGRDDDVAQRARKSHGTANDGMVSIKQHREQKEKEEKARAQREKEQMLRTQEHQQHQQHHHHDEQ